MLKVNKISEDIALVLVGHGSLLPHNEVMLNAFRDFIIKRDIFPTVEVAFLQKNEPLLEDVLRKFATNGIKKALVVPVFLAKGVHTEKDIPRVLNKIMDETELEVLFAGPLGADERMVDIIIDRANEAMARIDL